MTRYLLPALAGITCAAPLLLAGREWRMARKIYGARLWRAIRQMTTCWFLTWRYWFFYAATILLCSALGPVFRSDCKLDVNGFVTILLLATVAVITISWNVIPPGVLFLASSGPLSEPARRLVWSSTKSLGFRAVYLLQGRMKSAIHKNLAWISRSGAEDVYFEMDNLRTSDDLVWKNVLHNLIAMVPVVVLDIRSGSEGVSYELKHILERGFDGKTIFIIDEDDTGNVAEQLITDRLGPHPDITIVFPTEEELGRRVRESLWRQANPPRAFGKPRDARGSASPIRRRFTKWLCIRFAITACGALIAGILAYSVLTARVVVGRRVPDSSSVSAPANTHGQNIIVIEEGYDPQLARREYGVAGGAMLGWACAMGISCLRIIWITPGYQDPL